MVSGPCIAPSCRCWLLREFANEPRTPFEFDATPSIRSFYDPANLRVRMQLGRERANQIRVGCWPSWARPQ